MSGVTWLTDHASTASGHPAATRWLGLPLHGRWVRTTLHQQTNALLAPTATHGLVWAGTVDGTWTTADKGATWHRAGTGFHVGVASLGVSSHTGTVFAGGDDGAVYEREQGSFGGSRWRAVMVPLGADHPIFCVAPAPDGRTVLAGTYGALYRGLQQSGHWRWSRVYRTADSAITSILWTGAAPVYAAAFSASPAIVASSDGGKIWQAASQGLPVTLPTQQLVAMPGRSARVVLTTMGGGVWLKSAVGSWQEISAGLPARHAMPLVASSAGGVPVLYAGTMGFGVFARQGSLPWQPLGNGMHGGQYTSLGIVLAGRERQTLLVATALGVFRYQPAR